MYMTRLELDRTKRATILALSSPNKLHGAIESGFPGERRRRLWRIDELNGRCFLLIVSEDEPQLAAAAMQFAPEGTSWETRNYDAFLERIALQSRWHFRLAANPTISSPRGEGQRGKVYAHVTVHQQKEWLLSRTEKHGFSLAEDDFDVTKRGTMSFNRGASRQLVTLGFCVFEGLLTVTDANLFRQALTQGIGRGKAYGLGLITIAGECPPVGGSSL